MLTIKDYIEPKNLDEAYEILMKSKKNRILGGCAFLKLGSIEMETAIDLSNLDLNYITEDDNNILIGAYTNLRELEENPIIKNYCGGLISEGVSNIVGVQFRNMATVGASVFSKYGFSDLIPSLLVVGAKVRLHNGGIISIEDFLEEGYRKDILVEVIISKQEGVGVYDCLRKTSGDFSIINGAMFKSETGEYKIAIGARPQRAKLAEKASKALKKSYNIEEISNIVLEEIDFDTDIRGSKEYREDMCKALVKKMYKRVGDFCDK